jgi:hypothetical protein
VLQPKSVDAFFRAYFEVVGAEFESRVRAWLPTMRRLIALRTISWGIRWRVLSGRGDGAMAEWSADSLTQDVRDHMTRVTGLWLEPKSLQMSLLA